MRMQGCAWCVAAARGFTRRALAEPPLQQQQLPDSSLLSSLAGMAPATLRRAPGLLVCEGLRLMLSVRRCGLRVIRV